MIVLVMISRCMRNRNPRCDVICICVYCFCLQISDKEHVLCTVPGKLPYKYVLVSKSTRSDEMPVKTEHSLITSDITHTKLFP
jgi:hypothetical protein